MDITQNALAWFLGRQGIAYDTSKISVVDGVITKWTETKVTQPTVEELVAIKTNYQEAYKQALTDFSEYSDFYDNMIAKINAIPNCSELEAYVTKMVNEFFSKKLAELTKSLGVLSSLGGDGSLSLSSLGSVISWITKFVNSNLVGPYAKTTALLAITITKQAEVAAALANKMSELGCDI